MKNLEYAQLAKDGPFFTRIGMGCWAAGGHGWGEVKDDESISAIRHAFERGVNFFDTADCYGLGKSENILREALGENINTVFIASKGGVRWNDAGKVWNDSSPEYLRNAVEGSLQRLGIEQIPLYYLHKPDNKTPIFETMKALLRLREEGKIGEIGVANLTSKQLKEALKVAPIRAVQVQFNLLRRTLGEEVSSLCKCYKLKLVAWGVLADGLLTGKFNRWKTFRHDDHRSRLPDFQGDRFVENLQRIEVFQSLAKTHHVSMGQFALRWVMDKYEWACPLFGAKTVTQVEENIGAFGWHLSCEEMAYIDNFLESF